MRALQAKSARLAPQSRYTDVFGALLVAGQVFANESTANRKVLVVLSDMWHHTRELDLE